MNIKEVIQAIREEIEGRKEAILSFPENETVTPEAKSAIRTMANGLLSFLSNLEKSLPAKVTDGEEFEKEFSKFSNDPDAEDYAFPIDLSDYKDFARHFYNLGRGVCREGGS